MSVDAVRLVDDVFERLYRLSPILNVDEESIPVVIPLGPDAKSLWVAWFNEHTREMQDEAFPSHLRGAWAKMPAQLARLALILHACLDPMPDAVEVETVAGAADLVDYFKGHARRAYRRIRRVRRNLPLRLLEGLRAHGEMNQRAILHQLLQRNFSASEVKDALEELQDCGLVSMRQLTGAQTGGRPSTLWKAT